MMLDGVKGHSIALNLLIQNHSTFQLFSGANNNVELVQLARACVWQESLFFFQLPQETLCPFEDLLHNASQQLRF